MVTTVIRSVLFGKYINGRVCVPTANTHTALRTDEDFINHKYNDYQTGEMILNSIPNFKPVTDVLLDYMHLVCLGVVKKLILFWTKFGETFESYKTNNIRCVN